MFFTFDQNNSGGEFVVDENLAPNVIIEAASEEDAIARAIALGIYFEGVWDGIDCECCGDRWSSPDRATELPEFDYFRVVDDRLILIEGKDPIISYTHWTDPEAIIHYLDGRVRRVAEQETRALLGG